MLVECNRSERGRKKTCSESFVMGPLGLTEEVTNIFGFELCSPVLWWSIKTKSEEWRTGVMAWRWVFAASGDVILYVGIGGGCVQRLKYVQFKLQCV